jgi:hypothetical protein
LSAFKFHRTSSGSAYLHHGSRKTPGETSHHPKPTNQASLWSLNPYGDMASSSALVNGTGPEIQNKISKSGVDITSSLEELQTDEQRRILDTVAQVRKCGLESILSLPQLVVCGDQSAGKSSVLEALTEIPFPRNDNLCTRFATEIILRRAPNNSLTIKIIPDDQRSTQEQTKIKDFEESITDFDELPTVMKLAMDVMGKQFLKCHFFFYIGAKLRSSHRPAFCDWIGGRLKLTTFRHGQRLRARLSAWRFRSRCLEHRNPRTLSTPAYSRRHPWSHRECYKGCN